MVVWILFRQKIELGFEDYFPEFHVILMLTTPDFGGGVWSRELSLIWQKEDLEFKAIRAK